MVENDLLNEEFGEDKHPDALYDNLMAIVHPWKTSESKHFWERFYTVQNRGVEEFDRSEIEALIENAESVGVKEGTVRALKEDYLPKA